MKRFDATKYSDRQLQAWIAWFGMLAPMSGLIVPAIIFYLGRVQGEWTYLQAATASGLITLVIFPSLVAGWGISLRYSFVSPQPSFRGTQLFSGVTGGWIWRTFWLTQVMIVNSVVGTFGIGFLMTPGRRLWGALFAAMAVVGLVVLSLRFASLFLTRAAEVRNQPADVQSRGFDRLVARAGLVSMAFASGHAAVWLAAAYALLIEKSPGLAVLLLVAGAVVGAINYVWTGGMLRRLRLESKSLPANSVATS